MIEWGALGLFGIILVGILTLPFFRYLYRAMLLASSLLTILMVGYFWFGNGAARYQYHQNQLNIVKAKEKLKSFKNTDEVIQALRARLDNKAHSAKGWYLLGRVYASQGRWLEAQSAFYQAHHLAPNEPDFWTQYVVSLCHGTPKHMSEKNRKLFKKILLTYPNQGDTLMFLGMDAYLTHHPESAMMYWTRLLRVLPSDSDDAKMVKELMAKVG